jgi:glycerate kinase
VFASQKGATSAQARALERRLLEVDELREVAEIPGAGAAGGLGAALAALGAELVRGAALVLDLIGFDARGYDLVVTGEGKVDATTMRGKAPGEVVSRCVEARVRCVLFGGLVEEAPTEIETVTLSGDPDRAREDLYELGRELGAR